MPVSPFLPGLLLPLLAGSAIYCYLFLFALCAPLFIFFLLFQHMATQKIFPLRLAAHIAGPFWKLMLVAYLLPLLYVCATGAAFDPLWTALLQVPFLAGVFCCALAFPLLPALLAARKTDWSKQPAAYTGMAAVVALCNLVLLPLVCLCAAAAFFPHPVLMATFRSAPDLAVEQLLLHLASAEMVAASAHATVYGISTGLVLCAGVAGIWLILRRQRDDFGRDYYVYATKLTALWAGGSALLAAGAALFAPQIAAQAVPLLDALFAERCTRLYLAAGMAAFAAMLWLISGKSDAPLRLKGLTVFSFLLFCLALGMELGLFFPRFIFMQ